jgi:hypothetical protein
MIDVAVPTIASRVFIGLTVTFVTDLGKPYLNENEAGEDAGLLRFQYHGGARTAGRSR